MRLTEIGVLAAVVLAAAGTAANPGPAPGDDRVHALATTALLADLVENVGGDRVDVATLVPAGADPLTYEPTLRDLRDVVEADVAFSNDPLMEPRSVVRAIDANLRDGVPHVSLAGGAVKYAAQLIPRVENPALDTIWLGLRVAGSGAAYGATRASDVLLTATALDGPGDVVAYLTEAFGRPAFYVNSTDGLDDADTARLPPAAHTHMSWAFTEPGVYRLTFAASLAVTENTTPVPLGDATVTFAVGVDPHEVMPPGGTVLDGGHADLSVDLETGALTIDGDAGVLDPAATVVAVPNKALHDVPDGDGFRFLGAAGDRIFQLPQAVLGRHVHGEIDPHLWHDVRNAIAYTELIRDSLIDADPGGAAGYRARATAAIVELEELHREVRATLGAIPVPDRQLVTSHDEYAYLAAYDVEIAGFVTSDPAAEPSLADRRRLTDTVRNLDIAAVFLEPTRPARSSVLAQVAAAAGVPVCPIRGDTLDDAVPTYAALMRFNAASLRDCLTHSEGAE